MKHSILVTTAIVVGVAAGVGGYTFVYARGYSYMTNDPNACVNCHVMQEQYDGWAKASHRAVAACNDCHTPPSLIGKYVTKASNGFWHSFYFTTGTFPEPIRITPRNRRVTEQACRHCHREMVEMMGAAESQRGRGAVSCLSCHVSVGHMELAAGSGPPSR